MPLPFDLANLLLEMYPIMHICTHNVHKQCVRNRENSNPELS